MLIPRT